MPDLIDSITPDALAALETGLENAKTTIEGQATTIQTQGATITDLTTRLATAEGKLSDPNLLAAWDRVTTALAALQPSLVAPSPAPQGPNPPVAA